MIIQSYDIFDNIEAIYQQPYPDKFLSIDDKAAIHTQIYNPISELIWAVLEHGDDFKISVYDKMPKHWHH